jgi:hypothetical protein
VTREESKSKEKDVMSWEAENDEVATTNSREAIAT